MKNAIRPSVKNINDIFIDLMMIGMGKSNVDIFKLLSTLRSGVFCDDSLDVSICAFEIIEILNKERNAGSKKQSIVIRDCVRRLVKICRYYNDEVVAVLKVESVVSSLPMLLLQSSVSIIFVVTVSYTVYRCFT